MSDLGASSLHEEMDLEETQAAVVENSGKRRKEDDVTKELMKGVSKKAARQHERVSGKGREQCRD